MTGLFGSGSSAVVMLLLFKLHAGGSDLGSVSLTPAQARLAAENYAIETLHHRHST